LIVTGSAVLVAVSDMNFSSFPGRAVSLGEHVTMLSK
jgi:hypothetical protein